MRRAASRPFIIGIVTSRTTTFNCWAVLRRNSALSNIRVGFHYREAITRGILLDCSLLVVNRILLRVIGHANVLSSMNKRKHGLDSFFSCVLSVPGAATLRLSQHTSQDRPQFITCEWFQQIADRPLPNCSLPDTGIIDGGRENKR